jgi:CBS domain-containing protein
VQIPYTSRFLAQKLKLDDPCDVGPVHAIPGMVGGIAAGLWAPRMRDGFHGYAIHFWPQVLATVAAIAFGIVAAVLIFGVVDLLVGLRVSKEEEMVGLDLSSHGVPAYPEFFAESSVSANSLHVLSGVRVAEVMCEAIAVSPSDSLDAVQELMMATETFAMPVLDDDAELCGILTMADIAKIDKSERVNVHAAAVYSRTVQYAFPDQTVHEVIERMRDTRLANFPVVSRKDEKQLLGTVSKTDLISAYRKVALHATA